MSKTSTVVCGRDFRRIDDGDLLLRVPLEEGQGQQRRFQDLFDSGDDGGDCYFSDCDHLPNHQLPKRPAGGHHQSLLRPVAALRGRHSANLRGVPFHGLFLQRIGGDRKNNPRHPEKHYARAQDFDAHLRPAGEIHHRQARVAGRGARRQNLEMDRPRHGHVHEIGDFSRVLGRVKEKLSGPSTRTYMEETYDL